MRLHQIDRLLDEHLLQLIQGHSESQIFSLQHDLNEVEDLHDGRLLTEANQQLFHMSNNQLRYLNILKFSQLQIRRNNLLLTHCALLQQRRKQVPQVTHRPHPNLLVLVRTKTDPEGRQKVPFLLHVHHTMQQHRSQLP